jgi:hypothetical protein
MAETSLQLRARWRTEYLAHSRDLGHVTTSERGTIAGESIESCDACGRRWLWEPWCDYPQPLPSPQETARETSRALPDGWRIGEPLEGGRWRVIARGEVLDSRTTIGAAVMRARELIGR